MLGRTQTKANAWAQRRPDQVVPVHFVGKDLVGPRVTLKRGTFWETQDKRPIRLWGEAYGVVDAETRPFHELPFVTTVVAPCAEVANEIVTRGMDATAARAYIESWLEKNAS
jgi:hypothetical protein